MKKNVIKRMKVLFMAVIMTVGLTACGSQGNVAEENVDTDISETTDISDTKEENDTSSKKWVITTDTAFKPFEYTDENGDFVGIDMDILQAVASDQGFEYDLQVLGWDASIAACQAGQADGMIAGASITDERKESGWIFSDGYYDANQSMAVAADSDITGFKDLNGKNVAVKTGSMSADYAEDIVDQYGFTITYFEDSPTMYQAVVSGQVAACIDDTPIMACNIKETGIAMKIVEGTGSESAAYGFAVFNEKNQELVDMFNKGLSNIKANGTYDQIIDKYLGE